MLTDIHKLIKEFRNVSPKLKFAVELEAEKHVTLAVIALRKSQNSIQASIYIESCTTDCIMSNGFFYPANINYLAFNT
jgi:hypothetical protein